MLSNSKAMKELTEEQQNLQKELECLQAEHAQRMEEFYFEQRDLEKKLDQVMKQKCSCDSNLEKDKEAEYAAQVRRESLFQTKPYLVYQEIVNLLLSHLKVSSSPCVLVPQTNTKIDHSDSNVYFPVP